MAINKYNKYNVWRRYKTYDSGKTWVAMDDYEAYQTEENAESCGYIPVTYRWVGVEGTMCNTNTHTLYSRTRQQASYDRGQTWDWTEPAVYNYGEVIEENSPQCGYPIYKWVTVEGVTMCGSNEATKYNQYGVEKEQVSTDNGISWTDTGKQREGKMIENLSLKCGYVPQWKWEFTSISCGYKVPSNAQSAITRVVESTEYCENVRKYSRQNIELSTDNGATWSKTDEYKTTLLESASTDCGYAEQWVTIDGEYVCGDGDSRYNKYHKEKKKVSYDSGVTWTDTDETRKGDIIEEMSTDCGFDKSKTVVTYTDGTVKYFDVKGDLGKDSLNTSDKSTIKKVIVGSKVTSIGMEAFQDSSNLTSIRIPDSLKSISHYAFNYCSSLTGITIPDSVTVFGSYSFSNCSSLTGITLPNSITSINLGIFSGCTNLIYANIPSSVKEIVGYAFDGCGKLTDISLPNGLTSIGEFAFCSCSGLTDISLPSTLASIGRAAFQDSSLNSIVIPNSVTGINEYTFNGCGKLTDISLPNGLTSIGEFAFCSCSGLTDISLPSTLASIGRGAFQDCSGLTSITLPNSLTSIGEYTFAGCSSLQFITVEATTPPSLGEYAIPDETTTIYVPASSVDKYKAASGWSTYADKIQAIGTIPTPSMKVIYVDGTEKTFYNLTSIESKTVSNKSDVKNVEIYDGVTEIGNQAFSYCSKLTSVTIPDSVTSIENWAFAACTSLTAATIGNSVTSIGAHAFYDCEKLTTITIPASVTNIGEAAFEYCRGLTAATIGNSVTSIGYRAFFDCALTSITIPASVTNIGDNAFYDCRGLKTINYNGTIFQYKQITKGENWHYGVPASYVTCTDGTINIDA